MDIFQKALNSKHSTIIHGHYGRYPSLVQFYIDSIPELEPASDYELIFWYRPNLYKSRLLYILIEPSFDTVIPSDIWTIVLTSHLHLLWNPLTTKVIKCEKHFTVTKPIEISADQEPFVPLINHVWPFQEIIQNVRVDLSLEENCHEAYLKLLTVLDLLRSSSKWSLSTKHDLKSNLLKKLKPFDSKHDKYLLEVLG